MCIVCGRDLIESCFVFWDSAYCSYYCQRFYELKLTKYKPSKNTHTKHFEYYPPIVISCENCGEDTILRWRLQDSSKAFCSHKCNSAKVKSRSPKQYFPLKLLKHTKEPLLASEIAKQCDSQRAHRFTSQAICNILRIHSKKGIIERSGELGTIKYAMAEQYKSHPVKSLLR